MGRDIKEYLSRHGIPHEDATDLAGVLPHVDVVYQTRIQAERYKDPELLERVKKKQYIINQTTLRTMRPHAIILHPLPRNDEIAPEVDTDPRGGLFPPGALWSVCPQGTPRPRSFLAQSSSGLFLFRTIRLA